MSKVPYCFPIVGGRKIEHLHANIEALKLKLSEEQIKELESVVPFELGFPMNFVGTDPHTNGGEASFLCVCPSASRSGVRLTRSAGPR